MKGRNDYFCEVTNAGKCNGFRCSSPSHSEVIGNDPFEDFEPGNLDILQRGSGMRSTGHSMSYSQINPNRETRYK